MKVLSKKEISIEERMRRVRQNTSTHTLPPCDSKLGKEYSWIFDTLMKEEKLRWGLLQGVFSFQADIGAGEANRRIKHLVLMKLLKSIKIYDVTYLYLTERGKQIASERASGTSSEISFICYGNRSRRVRKSKK